MSPQSQVPVTSHGSGLPERVLVGPEEFEHFYERTWDSMVRLATLITGDLATAEDAAQEAYVGVFRRWSKLDREAAAPVPYLRMAVVNAARSALRRSAAAGKALERFEAAEGPRLAPTPDTHGDILPALQSLPVRQREVLILRYWMDLSEKQIAETLRVSSGTVKSSAARGIRALGRIIGLEST
jgi:RNA polymerase sigma-70 factor (sigma-E family)